MTATAGRIPEVGEQVLLSPPAGVQFSDKPPQWVVASQVRQAMTSGFAYVTYADHGPRTEFVRIAGLVTRRLT